MQWFRLYAEFLTDPTVQLLSFEDQRHFIAALCMKASGVLDKDYPTVTLRNRVLSRLIGLNDAPGEKGGPSTLEIACRRLMDMGLIDENWQPLNWEKRQYKSDHSDATAADRMRRYRERSKENRNVTDAVTRNVTPLDTEQIQNRTDTEQKKSKSAPKRATRVPEDFSPDLDYARAQCPDIDAAREAQKFRDWEFKSPRSDWPAVWRNWIETCRESKKYARKHNGPAVPPGYENVKW